MFDAADAAAALETPRVNLIARDRRPAAAAPKPAGPRPAARLVGPEHLEAIAAGLEEMRPRLQRDGGDCEFVGIEDGVVRVRLTGACVGCSLASMTVIGVRMKLTEKLGFLVKVIPV
jgi:NifU-like protein